MEIKNKLESSFKETAVSLPDELKPNVGAHLANRLTEEYEKFQVFQKMFNSILYERSNLKKEANQIPFTPYTDTTYTDKTDSSTSAFHDQNSQEFQVVLDEGQAAMLEERSLEIEQVLAETLDLHGLLQQIQLMTVQQGSLLDRIDVNLDKTRRNLDKTIVRLEKTEQSFSLHQKRLILFFITLAIFVTSLLILSK